MKKESSTLRCIPEQIENGPFCFKKNFDILELPEQEKRNLYSFLIDLDPENV